MSRRFYLLLGHPDKTSFNGQIADAYEAKLRKKGHKVRRQNVGEMKFDPILHHGYGKIQPLEPDLITAQDNLEWCDEFVVFYPLWWGGVPAILKGYLDRMLLPGFGFHYHKDDPFWDKLLINKTAKIFSTCDAPSLYVRFLYGNSDFRVMRRAVLGFCGLGPIHCYRFDRIKYKTDDQRRATIRKIVAKIR